MESEHDEFTVPKATRYFRSWMLQRFKSSASSAVMVRGSREGVIPQILLFSRNRILTYSSRIREARVYWGPSPMGLWAIQLPPRQGNPLGTDILHCPAGPTDGNIHIWPNQESWPHGHPCPTAGNWPPLCLLNLGGIVGFMRVENHPT